MPVATQENLRQMIDAVLQDYRLYDPAVIKRRINDHLRNIAGRGSWSGLLQQKHLTVPTAYTTGTVSTTANSRTVTGVATAWPTNDKVDTSLAAAIIGTGYQEATPVSMGGIEIGSWLVIGQGTPSEEAVHVIATTASTFHAAYTFTHVVAETVLQSRLAGLQFRIGNNTPFFTVCGTPTATSMIIDHPWVASGVSGQSYSIRAVYISWGIDCLRPKTAVNLANQYQLYFDMPKAYLDHIDARRTQSGGQTYLAVFHQQDTAGINLWELYPAPSTEQTFTYMYMKDPRPLEDDNDFLPGGIRSDVIVKLVKADAARWPEHRKLDGGIYYDKDTARSYLFEAEVGIEQMAQADQNTEMSRLLFDFGRFRLGEGFFQDKDESSYYGDV